MCIIVYKPHDKTVPRDTLRQCFRSNKDGAGFMYSKDGEVIIEKGFFTFESFWAHYQHALKDGACDSDMILHFRISTHGLINADNCHPFHVSPSLGMAHNGVIHAVDVPKDSLRSDTFHFVQDVLQELPEAFLDNAAIRELIAEYIGHSKLAFLDGAGKVTLINESLGTWNDGVWYSNHSYKPKKIKKAKTQATIKNQTPLLPGWPASYSGSRWDDMWEEEQEEREQLRIMETDEIRAWEEEQERREQEETARILGDFSSEFDMVNSAALAEIEEAEIQKKGAKKARKAIRKTRR